MIQLATDPNASRVTWRPTAAEAKEGTLANRRSRSGHAWPFIVRHGDRPAQQESKRASGTDSGS
jgi:hypothetical protein